MYDQIFALEFAMQQYQCLFPSEAQTEKKNKAVLRDRSWGEGYECRFFQPVLQSLQNSNR